MTNSPLHEELKTMVGMLMEAYFQETRTRFHGTEVWVWKAGGFSLYHLRADGYEQIDCSELIPGCDIELLQVM